MKHLIFLTILLCLSSLPSHAQDSLKNIFNKYGFSYASDFDGYVTSHVFKRAGPDKDEIIYLYQTTNTYGYNNTFIEFAMPQVQITFHKVEKVLNDRITPRAAFTNHTIQSDCFQRMLDASNTMHMKYRMIPVNTDAEKATFINYLQQFYEACAKSFFEDYATLERVDCHLSDLTDKEADQFIFSGNNSSIHRRLIIKSLTGNPGAWNYYEYLQPKLQAKKDVSSTYSHMYDLWMQIGERLGMEQVRAK